jgi:hypothetical protein
MDTTTAWVSDRDGALGQRVERLLVESSTAVLAALDAAEVVVWLAGHDDRPGRDGPSLTEMLADAPRAAHVVVVSSAMVYGAWANNPVPLTEEAALRPDFDHAHRLVALEHEADDWRRASTGRTVTVLRPAITLAADSASPMVRALAAGMGQRTAESDPPAQFLHLDDLASAIGLAVRRRLDGVRNVAPDGAIPGDRVRALAGSVPRLKLPERANEVVTNLRWRFQRGPIPPGLVSYTRHPWLVANDKIVADGWQASVTNEQAYVEGTEAKWWTMVSPKRRQELALGGAVTGAASLLLVVVRAIRVARAGSPVRR